MKDLRKERTIFEKSNDNNDRDYLQFQRLQILILFVLYKMFSGDKFHWNVNLKLHSETPSSVLVYE